MPVGITSNFNHLAGKWPVRLANLAGIRSRIFSDIPGSEPGSRDALIIRPNRSARHDLTQAIDQNERDAAVLGDPLVEVLDDHDSRKFTAYLVYVRQGPLPVKLRVFIDWMTPRLREMLRAYADPMTAAIN